MYIERLHIQNFRCFADTEFTLNYPGRKYPRDKKRPRLDNVNLFLGDNGFGKTSVFRAAVLSVLSPILGNSGFPTEYSVRRSSGKTKAVLEPAKLELAEVIQWLDSDFIDPQDDSISETSSAITTVGDLEQTYEKESGFMPQNGSLGPKRDQRS